MRRSIPLVLVPLLLFALPPAASAGGACRGGTFSDAPATVVEMKDFCFGPIVSRVEVGGTLTFVNKDNVVHGVGGVPSTFGEMHKEISGGDSVSFTFEESGVYPFLCIFHPGMAGAVVVGDGEWTGAATVVTSNSSAAKSDASGVKSDASGAGSTTAVANSSIWTWAAPLLGLGLVSLAVAVVVRRRTRTSERPLRT